MAHYCMNCGLPLDRTSKKYCNLSCQKEYEHKQYVKRWLTGDESGIIGGKWVDISRHIRKYIFEKYGNKCARCGWSEINPFTGTLPLEIEHIDGDALNNAEENLILLCPNCHSLTRTYKGANRGNGKRSVKWISREGDR